MLTQADRRRVAQIHARIAGLRLALARLGISLLAMLCLFSSVLRGTCTAAVGAGAPEGPPPCAAYARDWKRASVTPPFSAVLANGLTTDQGNWLVNGLAVIGLLTGIAVGLQRLLGKNASRSTQLEGQPIRVSGEHPCVEKPDFESHTSEIWKVTNGLRAAIQRIESSVASVATAREANGERLTEISRDLHELTQQVNRLAGAFAEFTRRNTK